MFASTRQLGRKWTIWIPPGGDQPTRIAERLAAAVRSPLVPSSAVSRLGAQALAGLLIAHAAQLSVSDLADMLRHLAGYAYLAGWEDAARGERPDEQSLWH
jgi:hypothetical protein